MKMLIIIFTFTSTPDVTHEMRSYPLTPAQCRYAKVLNTEHIELSKTAVVRSVECVDLVR